MKKIINSPKAPAPIGPYSQAVKVKDMLYLSGQIAINAATGKLVDDTIQNETEQVMKNINYVLEEAGMNFSNIIKCSIFLKDMDNFTAVNEVYSTYFSEDFPARECVQVVKLPKNVNVEITAIAAE